MATHSSVLAWRIPGTGEPRRLLSMGSHRVGHDWSDLAIGCLGMAESLAVHLVIPQYETKSLVKILKIEIITVKKNQKHLTGFIQQLPNQAAFHPVDRKVFWAAVQSGSLITGRREHAWEGGSGNRAGWLRPGRSPLADSLPSDGQKVPGQLVHDSIAGRAETAAHLGLRLPACGLAQPANLFWSCCCLAFRKCSLFAAKLVIRRKCISLSPCISKD